MNRLFDFFSKKKLLILIFIIPFGIFISCENDINTVNTITYSINKPDESAKDVELIYSENSKVIAVLKAPQFDKYTSENPYIELPKGVQVIFYDSLMKIKSKLTANYAKNYQKDEKMEARNNVVVVNEKNEKLNTEHLVWDQKKRMIFSDVFVKVTTKDKIILGEGLESDERFMKYKVLKPKGIINIDNNK